MVRVYSTHSTHANITNTSTVSTLTEKYPGAMPYFFTQDPDYVLVKERVAAHCANGTEPTGIATIEIGCDTLKVAEYLTPTLQKQLAA